MNENHHGRAAGKSNAWLYRALVSLAVGLICGGVCIPVIQFLFYGEVDPFMHGWPLCLEISALVLATLMALRLPCPIISAIGLYAGLVGLMLAFGGAEYPGASAIALAIHGLVPAACGTLLGKGILASMHFRVAKTPTANG